MTCIVAYDITDNNMRNRLARFLQGYGVRVQKSVFAVEVERHAFKRFLRELGKFAGSEGEVAVFRLCRGCQSSALQLGVSQTPLYVF
jgi:CRISPR-associated protein Cas2